jgi:hypothetical protein
MAAWVRCMGLKIDPHSSSVGPGAGAGSCCCPGGSAGCSPASGAAAGSGCCGGSGCCRWAAGRRAAQPWSGPVWCGRSHPAWNEPYVTAEHTAIMRVPRQAYQVKTQNTPLCPRMLTRMALLKKCLTSLIKPHGLNPEQNKKLVPLGSPACRCPPFSSWVVGIRWVRVWGLSGPQNPDELHTKNPNLTPNNPKTPSLTHRCGAAPPRAAAARPSGAPRSRWWGRPPRLGPARAAGAGPGAASTPQSGARQLPRGSTPRTAHHLRGVGCQGYF